MSRIQFAFFDSGTGGLPYMQHLKKSCPQARCLYFGDTRHFPYGDKSAAEITACALQTAELIIKICNPEAIVVACNTISVTALDALRERFSLPFVGTVPAVKLAASLTKNKRIGLLATTRTVKEAYTENLIEQFASDCTVIKRGDSQLISYIEHHLFTASPAERRAACKPAADFFLAQETDTVILGCTHFIHFAQELQELLGKTIQVIDSREGVVKQALKTVAALEVAGVVDKNQTVSKNAERFPDQGLFITGLSNRCDLEEYKNLCTYIGIPFMGVTEFFSTKTFA